MTLEQELAQLQSSFAEIDLLNRPRNPRLIQFHMTEIIVKRFERIRITIDGSGNHGRPHVHIDYGRDYHAASYAIDTGQRLVGHRLHRRYDEVVRDWIVRWKEKLLLAWNLIQTGQNADAIVCELRGAA